ncbi:hypothetical protein [Chitinophaga sp.]|uniref:hypothetical protein n=1 Tax=Chitinophaga sp. TaxID=1869181 RepID=UPI0031CEF74D
MKSLLALAFLFSITIETFAQAPAPTRHMTITIIDQHVALSIGKKTDNFFVTRDDTAQLQKFVDLNTHVKAKEEPAAYEQMMMNLLKPYYDQQWQLVTSNVEFIPNTNTEVFRYYFVK